MRNNALLNKTDILGILVGLSFYSFVPFIRGTLYTLCIVVLELLMIFRVLKKVWKDINFIPVLLIIFFQLINIIINEKNMGDQSWTNLCIKCIMACLFIQICFLYNSPRGVFYFTLITNILIYISLADVIYKTAFVKYDIMNTRFLLGGYHNGLGTYIIPIIMMNIYYILLNSKNKRFFRLSVIIGSIQLLIVQSTTSMIGAIVVIIIGVLLGKKRLQKSNFDIALLVISFVIFFSFVVFRTYNNALTRWFVVDVLHKSMDFTSRTYVWDKSLAYIASSFLWGHGRSREYQISFLYGVSSAHNIYLDILMQSGIVSFLLFITVLILMIIWMKKNTKVDATQYLELSFLAMLSVLQFESFCAYEGYPLLFVILTLAFYEVNVEIRLTKHIKRTKRIIIKV